MEVRCDKCQARYKVDDARIGPQGLTMRCGKCQNTMSIAEYLDCGNFCPFCGAAFNPGCARHYHCYFEL